MVNIKIKTSEQQIKQLKIDLEELKKKMIQADKKL